MADKTSSYKYVGNPGYFYPFAPVALFQGDVVKLTADQAAQGGEDFAPVNDPKPAPAADQKD